MSEDAHLELDPGLYRRWRAAVEPAASPDAAMLAAYAEGRLEGAEAETVEAALATDPALLETVLAARRGMVPEIASLALLRRAQAAVPSRPDDNVVPFRPRNPRHRPFRQAVMAWAAMAACLAVISTAGFAIGIEMGQSSDGTGSAGASVDLLGQVAGGGVG